jgi:predicted dehydrogenase
MSTGSSSRLRAAVVGCGVIAYEHLGFLESSPLAEIVGVCDTSAASARFAAERYGAAAWFTSYDDMLAAARPDVLHVLVPPHVHGAVTRAGLAAGCHVLCEKPLAASLAELTSLIDAARAADRRLMESQNLLFNEPIIDIHNAIARGDLGEVREIDILMSLDLVGGRFGDPNLSGPGVVLPGGAVHDFLPHFAYLFLHFAGCSVDGVDGRLWNASGNERVGFDQLDALVFAGRVRGRIRSASDLQPSAFRITVRGTKASIETDLYNPYRRVEGGRNIGKRVAVEHVASGLRLAWSGYTNLFDKVRQHGAYHGMPRMLDAFYRCIIDGQPQPVSFDHMTASAALVDRLVALGGRS